MKCHSFLKYLKEHNCRLFREGSRHSIFLNGDNGETTSVLRHSEIDDDLTRKICKDLKIPDIKKR